MLNVRQLHDGQPGLSRQLLKAFVFLPVRLMKRWPSRFAWGGDQLSRAEPSSKFRRMGDVGAAGISTDQTECQRLLFMSSA